MYQHFRSSLRSMSRSFSKSLRKRHQPLRAKIRRETLALEPLEDRKVMDANPAVIALDASNTAIANNGTITVKAGSPLLIPLDGSDADGGALTYEISSSNSSVITATKSAAANKWARITVENFGTMLFQLFDDRASRVTGHFEELAAANGYYNAPTNTTNASQFDNFNNTFHRVVSGFVIQAGDRQNGNGTGGSNLGDFDDQFSLDLQHNRTGILSMAKGADDTNDSQFFITDTATRGLDFNHSVFGVLVEGESVRAAIDAVAVSGSTPTTPVKITSIEIIEDNQNEVMLLKPAAGVTSGTSQITVRVTDPEGNVTNKVFTVQVAADDSNGSPFLNDVPEQNGTAGVAKSVQLVTQDAENDPVVYGTPTVAEGASAGTATINSSGLLTVTPAPGFSGTLHVNVNVRQTTPAPNTTDTSGDSQRLTFNFAPPAPTSVDLVAGSDSGVSSSDNITNSASLSFLVSGVAAGSTVKLFDGSTEIGTAVASSSTVTITIDTTSPVFAAGTHTLTTKQLLNEQLSAASPPLTITFDKTIAAFPAIPAQTAEGNVPFTFDVQHPDEAQTGFKYELTNSPPTGLTINQGTGVMSWTPTGAQLGTHNFKVKATDTAGNTVETDFTINITVVRLAQFSVIATNLSGAPITSIQKGQEFFLLARVEDLRPDATGVQKAFLDVAFDSGMATITGTIEHLGTFTTNPTESATAGAIDEVGGESTDTTLGGALTNLFRVKMRADETGELSLSPNLTETEDSAIRTASSSGATTELDDTNISFKGFTLNVLPNFTLVDETFSVDEDSTNRELDVLRNATKPTGEVLTITAVGARSNGGTVTIGANNRLIYTPAANFFGEETFTYTVENEDGDSLTASVTVEVDNTNDPPTAGNDTATTSEDGSKITINVLQNDSFQPDPSETLTIKSVSTGNKGGAINIDPTNKVIEYKPAANFNGTETFTYVVQDGHGGEATGTVTVTVTAANDKPTAVEDTIQVDQNVSNFVLNVLANDKSEPDTGETLTITGKTNPSHGTVVLEGGQLKYTPTAGFRGADSFTYTISDGNGGTATATVNLQVATSNVPPNANNDTATTPKNVGIDIDVLKNDNVGADTGETLTITTVTQGANGGKVSIVSGKVRYEPRSGFTGTDTFTYTIKDNVGTSDTATVTVTVAPTAPSTVGGVVFQDLNNNGRIDPTEPTLSGVTITLSGKDQAGATVNKTVTTDMTGHYQFTALEPGDYTVTESQPAFMNDGRAFPSALGTATSSNAINVKITGEGTSATALNFSELGRIASTIRLFELFGSTSRNSIIASARPGQASSFVQFGGTQWSSFQSVNVALAADGASATINAVNAAGQKVRATAPVTTNGLIRNLSTIGSDNLLRVFGGPAAFNLQPVANVAPSFTKGANQTALEDAAKVTVANWATSITKGPTDEASQTVSFTVTADKPELFEELPAVSDTGTLTFKPKANANGLATVSVVANDSEGASSAAQTFTITITAVNDVPSFTKGANQTAGEDDGAQSVTGWATAIAKGPATATDEAAQTLTFNVSNNNPNIFLVAPAIDATGKLTYTPKPNSAGIATVTVSLKDSGGTANGGVETSASQTFTITITGSNEPPVAVADTKTTTEGTATTINVLANDSDPDGDTLTVNTTLITPPTAAMGTAVVNADKTITFTPAQDFSGTATFTYQLEDGEGGITPGTVTVTVTNVNDAPVAVDDVKTVVEDTASTTINLLENDTDADDDDLTVTTNTEPTHGTLSDPDSQGVVTYTPDDDFVGTDTFTYTISDGNNGSDTATVTITVTAKNDAPSFVEGDDETVEENSGEQTVADWATDIAAGPDTATDEATQTLTFEVTTDNDDLFEVLPAIDADGTLTYTPAEDATGTATVTVKLKDNGGTANGGADTSTTKTFTITVEAAGALADDADLPIVPEAPEEEFAEGVDEFMASL
jgi:cyclophilin family peptidyl-prolyl cis-trans isomerase